MECHNIFRLTFQKCKYFTILPQKKNITFGFQKKNNGTLKFRSETKKKKLGIKIKNEYI